GLTMQFVNDNRFTCYSVVDERSAGFVALGMAQKMREPVIVCCTSGSAAANYYPAVTEAFYQNVPLVILTADRPSNFVDLFDGQTIRQENLFEKHSYSNVQLSEEEDDTTITENFLKIKDSMQALWQHQGPIHINMPFSEPLYESTEQKMIDIEKLNLSMSKPNLTDWDKLKKETQGLRKIMILVGMQVPDESFQKSMEQLSQFDNIIVLTESTSNLNLSYGISQIHAVLR